MMLAPVYPMPFAHPGLKIHRGERLAAHVAGKITDPDKNDIFMFHEKELRCSR